MPLPPADAPEHVLSAAWHASEYPILFDGMPTRTGPALGYGIRFPRGVEVGVALRGLVPEAALEGALRVELVPAVGAWRPAAGLEVGGATRTASPVLEEERPPGSYFADLGTPEPAWLDFTATPLRFGAGDWELGVGRVGVGVSLPSLGMAGRWSVDLMTVARRFE